MKKGRLYIKEILSAKIYNKKTGEEIGDWTEFIKRAFEDEIQNKKLTYSLGEDGKYHKDF